MIAESGPARIIEIDRDGRLLHEIKLTRRSSPSAHRHAAGAKADQRPLPGLPRRGWRGARIRRRGQSDLGVCGAAVRSGAKAGAWARGVRQQVLRGATIGQWQHAHCDRQWAQRAGSHAAERDRVANRPE